MKDFFYPNSVAVIGASRTEGKVGHSILKNIIQSGFKGEIVPVNPNADEILGIKASSTVKKVDLVVIAVPARVVPSVLEEAARLGVKAAIIISAGFRESGVAGLMLETQIKEVIKKYGIRVIGPNCLGVINTGARLNASFATIYPQRGSTSFVSQSGALCTSILDWAATEDIGFETFVSIGNKVDVTEADILEYLGYDPDTQMIALYVEGISNGREFMTASQKISRIKPIIALKSGRSEMGARAASSHTGSMAGSDAVYDTVFKQSGVIRIDTTDAFLDAFKAFSTIKIPKSDSVGIITNAGGLGVLASDTCAENGLSLTNFTYETIEELRRALPPEGNLYNPVDVLGDAATDRYAIALDTILKDENVGSVVVILTPQAGTEALSTAKEIARLSAITNKPILTCFMGGAQLEEAIAALKVGQVPNFSSPEKAIKAIGTLAKYRRIEIRGSSREQPGILGDQREVRRHIEEVKRTGRITMSEEEGRAVLNAYGLKSPKEALAKVKDKAVKAANRIGYPVVIKISSPDVSHKSDVGGLVVNIKSDSELKNAYDSVHANIRKRMPQARIDGVNVQKMVYGEEVIVGITRDPQFGPFITFGIGGIYVEILKDVSHRVAPIDFEEAKKMIAEIRSYPRLIGARGKKPLDIDAIADAIMRMSQIAQDFDEIKEIEVNPLIVQEDGCYAVDALIVIGKKEDF